MKRLALVLTAIGMLAVQPGQARAQVGFGGQLSFAEDVDLGVGARITYDLAEIQPGLHAIGTFDYFFPSTDGLSYLEVNANAGYDLPIEDQAFAPYVGGGLNLARASVDIDGIGGSVSGSNTDLGLNILGGIRYPVSEVTTFAEVRLEAAGGEQFVLSAGVLF